MRFGYTHPQSSQNSDDRLTTLLISVFRGGMQSFQGGAEGWAVLWLSYGCPKHCMLRVVSTNSRKIVIDVQPWQLAFDTEMILRGEIFWVVQGR